jgi:hypothetical protein
MAPAWLLTGTSQPSARPRREAVRRQPAAGSQALHQAPDAAAPAATPPRRHWPSEPQRAPLPETPPTADRPAWLPLDAGAAARGWARMQSPAVRPTLPDREIRFRQSTRQLALCSVARSRACGQSLPSCSRAQLASSGPAAPRGSCPYAVSEAVLAESAVSASGHVANTCPCSVPRPSGRGTAAVAMARIGPAAATVPSGP